MMDDLSDVKVDDMLYKESHGLGLTKAHVVKVERRGKGITIVTENGVRWDTQGRMRGDGYWSRLRLRKRTAYLDAKFREQQQQAALGWISRHWDLLSPEQRIRVGSIAAEVYDEHNCKETP